MNTSNATFTDVDAYIASFSPEVQAHLTKIRDTIKAAAPEAIESISYGMPAYKYNKKPVAYFAAFTHHIGFYATPAGNVAFTERLAPYKQGKGSVQFPINQPMPLDLISDMVAYNVERRR